MTGVIGMPNFSFTEGSERRLKVDAAISIDPSAFQPVVDAVEQSAIDQIAADNANTVLVVAEVDSSGAETVTAVQNSALDQITASGTNTTDIITAGGTNSASIVAAVNNANTDIVNEVDTTGAATVAAVEANALAVVAGLKSGVGSGINLDAWGRQKAVIDRSILHGMWTFNVSARKYKESLDGVELTAFNNATSVDGILNLASAGAGEIVNLDTFRNPRYQPNRGHLYSTSVFLLNKNALADRNFGMFTAESGVFFRLRNGTLYAVRRTTEGGITTDTAEAITLPAGVDLEKGNIYDIQMQWRGVGSYGFWINNILAHVMDMLGTLTGLSIFNPANPAAFECINNGDAVVLKVGCFDVTSEGGDANGNEYGSILVTEDVGQVQIQGINTPVIAVRAKRTVNGLRNTRDTLALLASASSDEHAFFRVWTTRDDSAIIENLQTWTDYGDGHLEYIINDGSNDAMELDDTKATITFGARVPKDSTFSTSALFQGRTEIYQTAGDTLIFTMHKEDPNKNVKAGVVFEFAEAI